MKKSFNTILKLGAVAALVSYGAAANADSIKIQMQLNGVDFTYDPSQYYDEIGTETGAPEYGVNYATFRDTVMNDGDSSGGADATFGDLNYADNLDNILVRHSIDGGVHYNTVETYDTAPIAIDFRIVLDAPITGAGSYNVISEYSFFDILTQDDVKDWGLALDATGSAGVLSVNDLGVGELVFTGLAGSLFNDAESNNLPFAYIDPYEDIQFGFTFNISGHPDWSQMVSGSGNGNVNATIPEPTALALWGAGLMFAGFAGKRRRKNKI